MKKPRQNVLVTRRVTRSMTGNTFHFPDELVFEICLRLPSKDRARCRCVCKLWSSMLRRQDFIESFFTRSCARPQILITCRDHDMIFFSSAPQLPNLEGKSNAVAANHLAPFPCSHGFSGGTNGLFCYSAEWFYKGQEEAVSIAVIYNPATGQCLTLPKLKSRMRYGLTTFIGYDPIAKEFKVLSMACPFVNNVRISVDHQVLTLGAKRLSWRKVQCLIPHLPSHNYICFSGVLYYIAGAPNTSNSTNIEKKSMVISFDLRTGKFSYVKLMETSKLFSPTLVNYNGKLGLLTSEDRKEVIWERKSFELWVLQDAEKHEWSKHVYMLPVSLKNVVRKGMRIVGMIGTNEIVLSPWDQDGSSYVIIYYNVESETITKVEIQGMEAFQGKYPRTYLNYVENVNLLKHFK